MYEKFRNEYSAIASERGIPMEALKDALRILDEVAVNYDFRPRELSLVPYNHELPEIAKMYIVCKKIQGLSDRTLEVYKRMLEIFFRAMQKPVEKITANDIRVYLFNYQQSRGCSNRSLDKYRGQLSSFFSWASDEGYLDRNPMKTIPPIKYEKKPRQNLSQLELEYLRTACETPRERAIIEFLFSTGCRVSELARVKQSDIDWNAKTVHLFGKGRKHRTSFINAKSEVTLLDYLKTRDDDCEYLFISERRPYRQLQTAAIEKIVRGIAARTAEHIQKPVTPHVLRHTTATIALGSGMPIEEIQQLLGHEKIDTTLIYAHTSPESVQAGHRRHVV